MTDDWAPPGHRLVAPLGGGLWTADGPTGRVLLRRVDAAVAAAATPRLPVVRQLPYVVPPRAVLPGAVLLDGKGCTSLAALVAGRGRLDPGEVVTVGVPLARALAAAAAAGLSHGQVGPEQVLVSPAGMPLLAGLEVGPGDGSGCEDVRALAALCTELLLGTSPGEDAEVALREAGAPLALVAVLTAGCGLPAARPCAEVFADLLRRSCPAEPLRGLRALVPAAPASGLGQEGRSQPDRAGASPLVESTAGPREQVARARRGRRRTPAHAAPRRVPPRLRQAAGAAAVVVGAMTAAGGLGAAVAAGWEARHPDREEAAQPAAAAAEAAPGGAGQPGAAAEGGLGTAGAWGAVLDQLDAARAEAFAAADPARLTEVYASGSPGLAADAALLDRLRAADQSAHRLRRTVTAVAPQRVTGAEVVLRVTDVLGEHEVRDAGGRVVHRVAARGEREFDVRLVRAAPGWRITSVTALG